MAQTSYTPILLYASGTATNVPLAANMTSSASGAELALNYADGKLYYKNSSGVVTLLASTAGASGDVVGPSSATDNALARFDTTTGKLIQNSVGILSDTGALSGLTDISASGSVTLSGGTANGVAYLNGSKVLTTGSALVFDGSKLGVGNTSPVSPLSFADSVGTAGAASKISLYQTGGDVIYGFGVSSAQLDYVTGGAHVFYSRAAGSSTERMRIDSSGNLGLGVTPSAWFSSYKAFQINTNGSLTSNTDFFAFTNNLFTNSAGDDKYLTSAYGGKYRFVSSNGQHQWFNAPSGTAGNTATLTQAMTLDASGNLLLGNTTGSGRLYVENSVATAYDPANTLAASPIAYFYNSNGATSAVATLRLDGGVTGGNSATTISAIRTGSGASALTFGTRSTGGDVTERARIDSSGNLLVGTTSQENSAKTTITFTSANNGLALNETSNSNNTLFLFFRQSSTTIGSVTRVGTTSAVIYNTASDYRLKDVIGAVSGSGERIDALKPINFKWTENDSQSRGFLAHEFQTVYPNSVTGDKDAIDADGNPVYQAMQASTPEVIADLVAEIQDLRKRLAALESK